MAQQVKDPNIISVRMWVWFLALLSGLRIQCCCKLWCRHVAAALIWPLAWELPYAIGAIVKRKKILNLDSKTAVITTKTQCPVVPQYQKWQPACIRNGNLHAWGFLGRKIKSRIRSLIGAVGRHSGTCLMTKSPKQSSDAESSHTFPPTGLPRLGWFRRAYKRKENDN